MPIGGAAGRVLVRVITGACSFPRKRSRMVPHLCSTRFQTLPFNDSRGKAVSQTVRLFGTSGSHNAEGEGWHVGKDGAEFWIKRRNRPTGVRPVLNER
jgi:hypothetical protein